jgi:DNA replication and repair protein RecF
VALVSITMYLTHLSLTNYRNFSRFDADVPRGTTLLVGANAQGKTSLLEAIYFLATFVAFHADHDRQVINFLTTQEPLAVARIVAEFMRGGKHHQLELRIIQESNGYAGGSRVRKEVLLDHTKHKLNEIFRQFNAVLFLPHMLRIIEGSPEERRRYLNLALAQIHPDYAAHLSLYNNTLTQRNALLKQLYERSGDLAQLSYWDETLARSGAHLVQARIQAIKALERHASSLHMGLTRRKEVLRLVYQPSFDPLPQPEKQFALPIDTPVDRSSLSYEAIFKGFLESLNANRGEEIQRGVTLMGPHRDELRFLANGVDLGHYGSRGQIRTTMLSMKLAEVAWMKERCGDWPVLLLDEVLAELDVDRRTDLLDRLGGVEQALLTTTDLDLFDRSFSERSSIWQVQAGRLVSANVPRQGSADHEETSGNPLE